MPDFQTILGCLLAVIIAIVASSMELMSKYQARTIGEIFFSPYYFFFVLLNAVFCTLVYWALPYISGILVRSEFLPSLENPLVRAITAGLGYLVIARTSLLDINIRGQTVGIGFDGIYSTLAQYLLRHHDLRLRRKMWEDFQKAFSSYPPHIFLGAVKLLMRQLSEYDREEFETTLARLKSGQPKSLDFCYGLYILLREYTEGREGAEAFLSQLNEVLKSDPSFEKTLREEFAAITS